MSFINEVNYLAGLKNRESYLLESGRIGRYKGKEVIFQSRNEREPSTKGWFTFMDGTEPDDLRSQISYHASGKVKEFLIPLSEVDFK